MLFLSLAIGVVAEQCNDTCTWAHDGVCQDRTAPSYGSRRLTLGFKYCDAGTDCSDCYGEPNDDSKPSQPHNSWAADLPIAVMSFIATLLVGVLVLWSKRRNDREPSVAVLDRAAADPQCDVATDDVADDLEDGLGDISLKVYCAEDEDDDADDPPPPTSPGPAVYKLLI